MGWWLASCWRPVHCFCHDRVQRKRLHVHIGGQRSHLGKSRCERPKFPRMRCRWPGLCVFDSWRYGLSDDECSEPGASKPPLRPRAAGSGGSDGARWLALGDQYAAAEWSANGLDGWASAAGYAAAMDAMPSGTRSAFAVGGRFVVFTVAAGAISTAGMPRMEISVSLAPPLTTTPSTSRTASPRSR